MSAPYVIAVSGFGRCGSSLVMQMLAAAGVPTTGLPPSYEPDELRTLDRAALRRWLGERRGHAVKFLDPHRFTPPTNIAYRTIWLRRDRWQQARSHIKFAELMRLTDESLGVGATHRFAMSYERDEPLALAIWRQRADAILELTFERLIDAPAAAASYLCGALRLEATDARLKAMAAVVRPRSPECYPGLLEVDLLADELAADELAAEIEADHYDESNGSRDDEVAP
jgi:hypothetical protein